MRLVALFKRYYQDHLYRNSIMVMMNLGLNSFAGFFFWIIAAWGIQSSEIGLATAAISLAMLIMTCSGLGMNNGLIRYLPQIEDKKTLFSSVLIVNLLLTGILTAVILLVISLLFPSLGFLNGGLFPLAFILLVLLWSAMSVQNYTLIALRRADLSLVQNMFCTLRIPLIFLIAFLGLASIFYSLIIAYVAAIIFGVIVLYFSGISFTFRLDLDSIRKILVYSLGNFTADLFVNAPMMIIPFIIINTIGPANNAYYYIAYSICGFLFIIAHGIGTSLFVEGSHDLPIKATTIKAIKLLTLILIPALILTFLFGDYVLMVFNAEYAEKSFDLLRLLAISSIFTSVISIYVTIQRVSKNIKMVNMVYMLYSASLIVLSYLLIVRYGLIGLGYAWIISSLFICLFISYNVTEKYLKSAYYRLVQS